MEFSIELRSPRQDFGFLTEFLERGKLACRDALIGWLGLLERIAVGPAARAAILTGPVRV